MSGGVGSAAVAPTAIASVSNTLNKARRQLLEEYKAKQRERERGESERLRPKVQGKHRGSGEGERQEGQREGEGQTKDSLDLFSPHELSQGDGENDSNLVGEGVSQQLSASLQVRRSTDGRVHSDSGDDESVADVIVAFEALCDQVLSQAR